MRGNRGRFHAAITDTDDTITREHLFRELDLAVLRHAARTRRAVHGGVRRTVTHFADREQALVTTGPHRTTRSPGRSAYREHAASWLRGIHFSHDQCTTDKLVAFDPTYAFEVTVSPTVFTLLAETLLTPDSSVTSPILWHGITIACAATGDSHLDTDVLSWRRYGNRAGSGIAHICPDDIIYGLYPLFDLSRSRGVEASAAAEEVRGWLHLGQFGYSNFPWSIGDGRPFDVPRPRPTRPRTRTRARTTRV